MFQREWFLVGLILVLILLVLYLLALNSQVVRANEYIVSSWNDREDYLISICEIDYNNFLQNQKEKVLNDLNFLLDKSV